MFPDGLNFTGFLLGGFLGLLAILGFIEMASEAKEILFDFGKWLKYRIFGS